MKPEEIRLIFERTKVLFPELLPDPSYTPEHPGAEGMATIFKIKLDELDRTNRLIEEAQQKFLSSMGCHSFEQLANWQTSTSSSRPPLSQPAPSRQPPTLGDFIKIAPQKGKRARGHKKR